MKLIVHAPIVEGMATPWQMTIANALAAVLAGLALTGIILCLFAYREWQRLKKHYTAELEAFAAEQKQRYSDAVDSRIEELDALVLDAFIQAAIDKERRVTL